MWQKVADFSEKVLFFKIYFPVYEVDNVYFVQDIVTFTS